MRIIKLDATIYGIFHIVKRIHSNTPLLTPESMLNVCCFLFFVMLLSLLFSALFTFRSKSIGFLSERVAGVH